MWGHVADRATADETRRARRSVAALLAMTQELAMRLREPYLVASTALGELGAYVRPDATVAAMPTPSG
jgi:hypothetical protein